MTCAWVGGSKQPPYSIHAEKALLGACLAHPEIVEQVVSIVPAGEAFFRTQHGQIYDTVRVLWKTTPVFDREALAAALQERGILDDIGGRGYLVELSQGATTPETAIMFARQVQDKALLRRLIDVASDVLSEAYGGGGEYTAILTRARARLDELEPKTRRPTQRSAGAGRRTKKPPADTKSAAKKTPAKKPGRSKKKR